MVDENQVEISNVELLHMAADIAAAYVSNNTAGAEQLPEVIRTVHQTLSSVGLGEALDHARLHRLPGRRQEAQDAEAPPALGLRLESQRVPGKMGAARGLPHGGPELRQATLRIRQENRFGAKKPARRSARPQPGQFVNLPPERDRQGGKKRRP